MNLTDVFTDVAHKQLVAVDLPHLGSNQHELNASGALKEFFGTQKETRGALTWFYFRDDETPVQELNEFTFYDARAKSFKRTGRSEWRFYYYGSFLSQAKVGDWLVLARTKASDRLVALVFQQNSAWLRAARSLFGIVVSQTEFERLSQAELGAQRLELLQRGILEQLGFELEVPTTSKDEELVFRKFGRNFPSTKQMAAFARAQIDVDVKHVDEALVRWLEREEQLFRALENLIIGDRIKGGFSTVDEFIGYSLTVQNRRKSRMGHALQNHLAELLTQHGVRYTAQARTEVGNRPDFIFPGQKEYHDKTFKDSLLVMLGVKSTSKDRWRQVLDEADRIEKKHLCTLEAAISVAQTDAMRRRNLTLVVPLELHATFTEKQRMEIMTVGSFIDFVLEKQS